MELPAPQWAFPRSLNSDTDAHVIKGTKLRHAAVESPVTPSFSASCCKLDRAAPITPDEIAVSPTTSISSSQAHLGSSGLYYTDTNIDTAFVPGPNSGLTEALDEFILPDNINLFFSSPDASAPLNTIFPPQTCESSSVLTPRLGLDVPDADFLLPDPIATHTAHVVPSEATTIGSSASLLSDPSPTPDTFPLPLPLTESVAETAPLFMASTSPVNTPTTPATNHTNNISSTTRFLLPEGRGTNTGLTTTNITSTKLACRELELRAKALACEKYEQDHRGDRAPRNSVERRKRVRNKSAYVSRHSRRRYSDLLVQYYKNSAAQRDAARTSVVSLNDEIGQLRKRALLLIMIKKRTDKHLE